MEYEALVARINALAKKSREQGLTADETVERDILREEYLERIRQNFRAQMETTYGVDSESGKKTKVKPKQ